MGLFFKDEKVGSITEGAGDFPWFFGVITLTPYGEEISSFLYQFTDEDIDPPWDKDDELLNHEFWYIIDENKKRQDIEFPAVHKDAGIFWRKR